MVIDTSAIVAILLGEDDEQRYASAIEAAATRLISAVTRVELAFVIEGRKGPAGGEWLEQFLAISGTETVAVTPQQAMIAVAAFRTWGKGRHAAGLNIGDCFSYALAKSADLPLLFKGNDFARTDIRRAVAS